MKLCRFIFLFFLPALLRAADVAYFTPPSGWQIADPGTYAPMVTVCFIEKKKTGIIPSINLSIEENVGSLEEYANAVRSIHESEKNNRWRKLTTLQTNGPSALLTEIDTYSGGKPMRLLQLLIVHNHRAYILTAAALKSEINRYYESFLKAFKSFTITENLLESIPDTRRSALLERVRVLKEKKNDPRFENTLWKPFQMQFLKEFADMGLHWQILALGQFQLECEIGTSHDQKTTP